MFTLLAADENSLFQLDEIFMKKRFEGTLAEWLLQSIH